MTKLDLTKNKIIYAFGLFVLLCICNSCEVVNPEEGIPAYIHIEEYEVIPDVGQGTSSSRISEVFVFAANEFQGAYDLPHTFPVLLNGQQSIEVFAGIQENGVAATPGIYTIIDSDEFSMVLEPNVTDTLRPSGGYIDGLEFAIVESFDNNLQVFRDDKDQDEMTEILAYSDDAFEGGSSGRIVLTQDHPIIEVGSMTMTDLPVGGAPVYIELNYKNTVPFEVGIYFTTTDGASDVSFVHGLNTSEVWNKVYLKLTDQFNGLADLSLLKDYQIGIRAAMPRDENGDFVSGTREILLDNFKFIYRK